MRRDIVNNGGYNPPQDLALYMLQTQTFEVGIFHRLTAPGFKLTKERFETLIENDHRCSLDDPFLTM